MHKSNGSQINQRIIIVDDLQLMKIKDYGNKTLQFDVDELVCHLEN